MVLLNRGQRKATPAGAKAIVADIRDPAAAAAALAGQMFDVVVNFIAFTPQEIERDLELLRPHQAVHFHQFVQCLPKAA